MTTFSVELFHCPFLAKFFSWDDNNSLTWRPRTVFWGRVTRLTKKFQHKIAKLYVLTFLIEAIVVVLWKKFLFSLFRFPNCTSRMRLPAQNWSSEAVRGRDGGRRILLWSPKETLFNEGLSHTLLQLLSSTSSSNLWIETSLNSSSFFKTSITTIEIIHIPHIHWLITLKI